MEVSLLLQHTFTLNLRILDGSVKYDPYFSSEFSSSAHIDPKPNIYCILTLQTSPLLAKPTKNSQNKSGRHVTYFSLLRYKDPEMLISSARLT